MIKNYNTYLNEGKTRRGRSKTYKGHQDRNQQRQNIERQRSMVYQMVLSEELFMILRRISDKGNAIAKDLLKFSESKDTKFSISFISTTNNPDQWSFVPITKLNNIPPERVWVSNYRERSNIHRLLKKIFKSNYTNNDIQKFRSMYKEVYNKGFHVVEPTEQIQKVPPQDVLKNIEKDTKEGKMKWSLVEDRSNYNKYKTTIDITKNKFLVFYFYYFKNSIDVKTTFMIIHLKDIMVPEEKNIPFIYRYKFEDLVDFIEILKSKDSKFKKVTEQKYEIFGEDYFRW